MRELALFAGAGGGILGGKLLGWRTVCAVELDAYARHVLLARQRDGILEPFPVWDDVRTFDGKPWRGHADVVSGGFPCVGISSSGKKEGLENPDSALWHEMARIIGEVRPRFVLMENSSLLPARGLGQVLGDLAALGFDAAWDCFPSAIVGAPQARERLWLVAHVGEGGREGSTERHSEGPHTLRWDHHDGLALAQHRAGDAPSRIRRVDDAVANRVDRVNCAGNGQVPGMVPFAFSTLYRRLVG